MNPTLAPPVDGWTVDALLTLDRRALSALLRAGHPLRPEQLDDTQYKGISLGLPAVVDRLLWKTFRKTFHRGSAGLRGWNVRLQQTGIPGPGVPLQRRGRPVTFGHYRVVPGVGRQIPQGCNQGVLLDYVNGGNTPLDPAGPMMAPVVALNPGRADLLLGWDYVQLGPMQIPTPAYWALSYEGPLEDVVPVPRPG